VIDTRPPQDVADEAAMGIELTNTYHRGGTAAAVRAARDLVTRRRLSTSRVRQMDSYFTRYAGEVGTTGWNEGDDGYPSAVRIEWALWGGSAGAAWSSQKVAELDQAGVRSDASEVQEMRETRAYRQVEAPELRALADGTPVLTGYGAVFEQLSQDLGGFVEIIDSHAFDTTLARAERNVLGSFNHNLDILLSTRDSGTLDLTVDNVGLQYAMQLNLTDPDAQRVAAKVEGGLVKGSSFSFAVRADEWTTTDSGFPLRRILDCVLYELGPVASPAYLQTAQDGAAVALRSLSKFVDLPLEQVTEAAQAGRLSDLIARDLSEVPVEEPAPEAPRDTPAEGEAPARRGRRNPPTR
jgi:hypothetical protein